MNAAPEFALILLSVGLLVAVMAVVRILARSYGWSAELQRKSVHVATGGYALSLPLMFTDRWPVLVIACGAVIVLLVMRMPIFAKSGLGTTLHSVERRSYGDVLLAMSVGIVFFFSRENPVLYVLPIAVVTLSDAAAALTGVRYGRVLFNVETGAKSLEGSAMFFAVTWITAMILLLLMTGIGRENVVLLSLIVAAFGTLVEADSWQGFDNLFLPVGLHLFLASHLDSSLQILLGLTGFFLVVLAVAMVLARELGLSGQAARAYTIAIFVICAVTAIHNAVLPVVVILAHLVLRHLRPGQSDYPDLDVVAVVVVIAVFWLFLGRIVDQNAINMYNLSFAGCALIFIALAAGNRFWVIAAGTVALGLYVVFVAVHYAEVAYSHGALWPWICLSFALCLAVVLFRPVLFDRYRGPRTLLLALFVPLVAFMTRVFAT